MDKITAQLAVIEHFKTSKHKEGFKKTSGGMRALCDICRKADLNNKNAAGTL